MDTAAAKKHLAAIDGPHKGLSGMWGWLGIVADLRFALEELEESRKETRHWKANHDQQVAFKRVTAQKRDEFKVERDEARRLLQTSTLIHQFDMLRVKPYWRHRRDCNTCAAEAFLAQLKGDVPWCQGHAESVAATDGKYPSRRGECSLCGREGPVDNSGRTFRHRRIVLRGT